MILPRPQKSSTDLAHGLVSGARTEAGVVGGPGWGAGGGARGGGGRGAGGGGGDQLLGLFSLRKI